MRTLSFFLKGTLSLLLLLSVSCAARDSIHPDQLTYPELVFHLPEVEQLTLPNGIRLYLKEDNELPLVQVTAMIDSGAIATPVEKVGFDDLFAAAWRTGGTENRSPDDLEERLDQLAADLGGSMGPYSTQMSLSVRTDDLAEGLAIFAEMLRQPAFAAERLELERLKAQERVRRQNDNPGSIARRLLRASLYPDHFLGATPTTESLAATSRQDLLDYHNTYFAPNNLRLAISGDFDRQQLMAILQERFGDWSSREVPETVIPELASSGSGKVQMVDRPVPQTTLLIGAVGLSKDHPDHYTARVMNYILGGGSFNSRMMREIRSNRGLAYSAYSYVQVGRRLPGAFVAGTETSNETVPEVLTLIREIMQDLRDNPVTEEELQLAKESQINSFVFGFDDSHAVVAQQMRLDFFDYPEDYLVTYRDRIAEVTAEDVQRVARELIHFDQQQIIMVGGTASFAGQFAGLGLPVEQVSLESLP